MISRLLFKGFAGVQVRGKEELPRRVAEGICTSGRVSCFCFSPISENVFVPERRGSFTKKQLTAQSILACVVSCFLYVSASKEGDK